MSNTGDRPDIGFLTEWQAAWLVSGDADSETTWRAGAEATGTMAFWARDAATGGPVNLLQHPLVAYKDAQGGRPHQMPICARPAGVATYFILNEAHMPAAAFVPWLLTDDPYFLEGAQAAAQYGIMESNYRPLNEKLPALANTSQPRSFAWSLRDLMQLAAFAPERVPAWLQPRAYWQKLLPNSLTYAGRYLSATSSPDNSPSRMKRAAGAVQTVGFVYDLVAEAGSSEGNGVRARHDGRYGDSAGFASRGGQAGACRF
jgi:hypothetical protein